MVLDYLNMLTQAITITDSMFNFGNFFTKNAIIFDLTKIGNNKIYFVVMTFCCASNAAIKNFKIARNKINFFLNFLVKS